MTAPARNTRQAEPQILPEQVTTNLSHAEQHLRVFLELSSQASDLDPQIAEAQATLDRLKARYSQLGADSTKQEILAKAFHEMALDHCKKYGYGPMPAAFDDMVTHLTQQMERINPAVTIADTQASPIVQPDPLTDAAFKVA